MNKFLIIVALLFTIGIQSQTDIQGFYLSRYSPVIDLGTMDVLFDVGGEDFYGNPRFQGKSLDMGAAEFQDPWDRIVVAKLPADMTIFRGQEVNIMASGGEKYTWSTGDSTRVLTVTPQQTTTYSVTVEEYGTISTDEITVTVKEPIIIQPIANVGNDIVVCEGEQLMFEIPDNPEYTYLWSTGEITNSIVVTATSNQMITCTITSSKGSTSDTVVIYVNIDCN